MSSSTSQELTNGVLSAALLRQHRVDLGDVLLGLLGRGEIGVDSTNGNEDDQALPGGTTR